MPREGPHFGTHGGQDPSKIADDIRLNPNEADFTRSSLGMYSSAILFDSSSKSCSCFSC